MKSYHFNKVETCEMCGSHSKDHKTLGQRLNREQGKRPKKRTGIAVSIVKCNDCGIIYSQPKPIPFDIQDHYGTPPEEYWNESYFQKQPDYFSKQIAIAKKLISVQSDLKALDIGAGLGKAMLSLEDAGFEAFGLEPSKPFYERAISKMGISEEKLKLGMIEDIDYPKESFDFLTFGAVFEHLYNPAECLERSLQWTKKGGIIHLEIPSADWLIPKLVNFYYRLIGTNYVTNLSPMHPPYHLHEYTLKSFKKLGEKLGFDVEFYQYDVCIMYFIPGILKPFFRWYMDKTNKGMQLTVYLKKK